jgi:hypothetical protein
LTRRSSSRRRLVELAGRASDGARDGYGAIMLRLAPRRTRLSDGPELIRRRAVDGERQLFGIPLFFVGIVLAPIVGPWAAAALLATGGGLQFFGHFVQGQKPAFLGDPRFFVMGGVWWLQRVGVPVSETRDDPADLDAALGGLARSDAPPPARPRDLANSL